MGEEVAHEEDDAGKLGIYIYIYIHTYNVYIHICIHIYVTTLS